MYPLMASFHFTLYFVSPTQITSTYSIDSTTVPDRDPVPRIDDLAENYQRIECRAPANRPYECHLGRRSLCEILYTCGSEGRPGEYKLFEH